MTGRDGCDGCDESDAMNGVRRAGIGVESHCCDPLKEWHARLQRDDATALGIKERKVVVVPGNVVAP